MDISLSDRAKRLHAMSRDWNTFADEPLLRATIIDPLAFARLEMAMSYYLWDNLIAAGFSFEATQSEEFFTSNIQNILKLPNLTPNGLLLPKRENFLSYNAVQREVCHVLNSVGLAD